MSFVRTNSTDSVIFDEVIKKVVTENKKPIIRSMVLLSWTWFFQIFH